MAKHFDPRKVLKQVSNALLAEFFGRQRALAGLPWQELGETNVEPIFEAWQALPEEKRKAVQVVLQDVNEVADERGLRVLAEEIHRWSPERMGEFDALEGRLDKAFWTYLNLPAVYDEAALFARADALATGRYWTKRNSLPRLTLEVTDAMKRALGDALVGYYQPNEARGHWCLVEHYQRLGGAEYFFAYLDDYPDTHLVFDDAGQMRRRPQRDAFTNVFVYNPTDGSLEMYARGGKKVRSPLQHLFCQSVLGIDVDPAEPDEPAYHLDGLTDPAFPFPTAPDDRVTEVRVRRLRLEPVDAPRRRIILEADLDGPRDDIYAMIEQYLDSTGLPMSRVRVTQVTFHLTFINTDRRGRSLTFTVGYPNSCDLKSKPDEMRDLGERCLKLWGISHE